MQAVGGNICVRWWWWWWCGDLAAIGTRPRPGYKECSRLPGVIDGPACRLGAQILKLHLKSRFLEIRNVRIYVSLGLSRHHSNPPPPLELCLSATATAHNAPGNTSRDAITRVSFLFAIACLRACRVMLEILRGANKMAWCHSI